MESKRLYTKNPNKDVYFIREVLKVDRDQFVFAPEDPKDGLSVTIVWGSGEGEKDGEESTPQNQQGKENQQGKQRGQDRKGKEDSNGGDGNSGESSGSGGSDFGKGQVGDNKEEGSESEDGSEEGGKEDGQRGRGGKRGEERERGKERGKESGKGGDGEPVDSKGKQGDQEGKDRGQGEGEKGSGKSGSSSGGDQGGNLDDMDIDDILGGGGNSSNNKEEGEEGGEGGEPGKDREKGKERDGGKGKGKDGKEKSGKDGKGGKESDGEGGRPRQQSDGDQEMEGETSHIGEFPPTGDEEPDPKILDVVFGKTSQVEEKEDKLTHKSFVFSSDNKEINVFKIEYKVSTGSGDRTYIKKLANLVYHLYEPFLRASSTDLDPSEPVVSSPISPQGLRSPRAHERPIISYGAISRVEKVDFYNLIVFIDVSGSMDMSMVGRAINSYFYSVFTGLKKTSSQVVKVIVVLHGTNAGVFGVSASWRSAGSIVAKVAESARGLVGYMNGSESTLTHRVIDILKTVNPLPGANISNFLFGQVPIIWVTDFLWSVSVSSQFTNFLRNKPALLISTSGDPEEEGVGSGDVFGKMGHDTALTILRKIPYGALVYFPSFVGVASGEFDPEKSSPSSGSGARVYAKGQAYEQLVNSRGKIGNITVIRVR